VASPAAPGEVEYSSEVEMTQKIPGTDLTLEDAERVRESVLADPDFRQALKPDGGQRLKTWQEALDPDNWGEAPDFQVDEDGMTVESAVQRLKWLPIYMGEGIPYRCTHCHLLKNDHVRDGITLWCAEWRLRQMYGDR
jgi:hypothetical protein